MRWVAIVLVCAVGVAVAQKQQRSTVTHFHFPGEEDTLGFYHSFLASEVEELMRRDTALVLLDVRPADQFAAEHIPGSINIPLDRIEENMSTLRTFHRTQRNVVIISRDGKDARRLTRRLLQRKFNRVWYLHGGIEAWKADGRQLQQSAAR